MSTTLIYRVVQSETGETEVEPVSATESGATEGEPVENEAQAEAGEAHTEEEEEVANPILPTANELFYGTVAFFLLWALFKWVLLPPVLKVQDSRAERIRADKEAAENAAAEAAQLRVDYDAGLATARAEATRIIDDARHASDQKRAAAMARVEAEIAEQRAAAAAEVEAAKAAALEELKSGVGDLAVEAAQLVVQKDIDAASQQAAIDDYVSRAGTR